MRILGISGSLRKASYNTAVLRFAATLLPAEATFEQADLAGIPVYDEDVKQAGFPAPVVRFREAIHAADALVVASPEYNFSVPGPLKNAIDWASRPPDQPFDGKPVAILGASTGVLGTARMQYHLRQILGGLNAWVVPKPEVMIASAAAKLDAEGRLVDDVAVQRLRELLGALMRFAGQARS